MRLCFEVPEPTDLNALATSLEALGQYLAAVAAALRAVPPPAPGETPETPTPRRARGG